ncbi:DNA recombination protein RmuC [soil metagenome]
MEADVVAALALGALVVVAAVAAGSVVWARRTAAGTVAASVAEAVAGLAAQQVADRDHVLDAVLRQVDRLNRAQMETAAQRVRTEVETRHQVIDRSLDEVRGEIRNDLARLGDLVSQLGQSSAERFGQVDESLRQHALVAGQLADSTQTLRQALANPQARGQWGERMAEDVLRLAGFVEHVNYRKQTAVAGGSGGRPDFTFQLPKGHVLYMDVKFPMASYLRWLEAPTDTDRDIHLRSFLRDVRARVKELSKREYERDGDAPSVDYVLLFLPNEQLSGFIHEHDPTLLDDAMRQRVVMCSPLTLFAFLGVIRQAFDNFVVEQTSHEILALFGAFQQQWGKYTESADKVKRHLRATMSEFDQLTSTRERMLEQPLRKLDALRAQRGIDATERPSSPTLHVVDRATPRSVGGDG